MVPPRGESLGYASEEYLDRCGWLLSRWVYKCDLSFAAIGGSFKFLGIAPAKYTAHLSPLSFAQQQPSFCSSACSRALCSVYSNNNEIYIYSKISRRC